MAISRRRLIQLLGGSAMAAPLMPIIRRAVAQPAMGPMRFLAVRTPHGVDRDFWIPRESSGADPASADAPLSSLTFEYENSILAPLMPWRDKITVLDGLDTQVVKEGTRGGLYTNHGHNEQGTMLTGAQAPSNREGNFDGHPSLDFVLHGRLGAPVLITASVGYESGWKCMSYDDSGRPRGSEGSPNSVFDAAFRGFTPPMPTDPMEPVVDYTSGENQIVDYSDSMLRRLQARLQGSERDKLDAHLAALASLRSSGMGPGMMAPPAACTTTSADGPGDGGNLSNYQDVIRVAASHARVIAQAFACGRSRSATLQLLDDYPNWFTDVPEVRTAAQARFGGDYRFHEDLVHGYWGASGSDKEQIRTGYCAGLRWSATHFAAVLQELDNVTDPQDPNGGSILDNTIVYWHNEFGHDGHDNQHTRHPVVIAGGGGRTLKTGRYLRLRNISSNERVPHNKLLVSIAHAMGLTDIDFFGDRDVADDAMYRGPLEALMA